ncbi:uncharacterized protein LOC135256189 [Anguilla rostrata]|uniref:uncharacterized protein LOC135256189 n=1 Tax=Anguilla rostrata TaxID=7938 RepID=UPI0030CE8A5B
MPKSVRDRIMAVLDTLSKEQLLRFKRKLSELDIIGYGRIENEGTVDITHRLVSKFTVARAIPCIAEVLRAIDLQEEAGRLEQSENDREGANVATGAGAASPTAARGNCGSATNCSPKPTEGQCENLHPLWKKSLKVFTCQTNNFTVFARETSPYYIRMSTSACTYMTSSNHTHLITSSEIIFNFEICQHFVDKNHVELITRITAVNPILDRLYRKKLISIEMLGVITAEKTNEDRMRKLLYDVILPQGEGAKDELVAILDEQQPYIMGTLRGK